MSHSACLWIASKLEEVDPPNARDFVGVVNMGFDTIQLQNMELNICFALGFKLQHKTGLLSSNQVICTNNLDIEQDPILKHMIKYLMVLSRFPRELITVEPNITEEAVVVLAHATVNQVEQPTQRHHDYKKTCLNFGCVVYILLREHQKVNKKNSSAFLLFSKEKYMRVSLLKPADHTNSILNAIL